MIEKTDVELAVFVADYLRVEVEQLRNQPTKNIIQALDDYSRDEALQIIKRLEKGGYILDNAHEEFPPE
jgi:hypothetical protein